MHITAAFNVDVTYLHLHISSARATDATISATLLRYLLWKKSATQACNPACHGVECLQSDLLQSMAGCPAAESVLFANVINPYPLHSLCFLSQAVNSCSLMQQGFLPSDSSMMSSNRWYVSGVGCSRAISIVACRKWAK